MQTADGREASQRSRVRSLLAALLDLAHTRLDLLGTELREELLRFAALLVGACVVVLATTIGLGLLAAALVMALWQDHPLAGLSVAGMLFLALGLLAIWSMARLLRAKARPFEASLTQLRRDREALRART
ncbi:MAG: phage holin family protein [Burkholderiales bacterium]|nr:phage holin family protein [Burkholderiales bacterium]